MDAFNTYVLGVAVPVGLLLAGAFYIIKLKGFFFFHPLRVLKKLTKRAEPGGISPFRALTMALAGTLGVGNLVGVSAAIVAGGAGAVFWMWVSATLAMVLKYAEIVLAIRHRDPEGHGGAMYYMREAFTGKFSWIGRVGALIFAALCLVDAFSMGCVVQVNAVAGAVAGTFSVPAWIVGAVTAVLVLLVGAGGADKISSLTEKLVPLMTAGFVVLSLAAISFRAREVPAVLSSVVRGAFRGDAVGGGVLGFLLSRALRFGTMRGLLSNEAGCGTSPMAHATAATSDAAGQGCLGIVEVFVDTHILCTMTALVVLLAIPEIGNLENEPMLLTIRAYEAILGRGAGVFLTVAVICFGLATVFCWAHYAGEACGYLCGFRGKNWGLRGICLWVYSAFCVVGAVVAPESVWTVADFSIGCMTVLNLVFLVKRNREVIDASADLIGAKRKDRATGAVPEITCSRRRKGRRQGRNFSSLRFPDFSDRCR